MGLTVLERIPRHCLPLVVVVLVQRLVFECRPAENETDDDEDADGDDVGEDGGVPGLLHIRTRYGKSGGNRKPVFF